MAKPLLHRIAGWLRDRTPKGPQAHAPESPPGSAEECELTVKVAGAVDPADVVGQTCRAIWRIERTVPKHTNTVTERELSALFERLTVYWVDWHVPEDEWVKRARSGRWVVSLQWAGTLDSSELYHAIFHLINRAARLPNVAEHQRNLFEAHDESHREREWWAIIERCKAC